MRTHPISVVIPVGPLDRHSDFVEEAIESCFKQTEMPNEVLVFDNGTGLRKELKIHPRDPEILTLKSTPWALGLSGGFNVGLALARNDLVVFLGSDDHLYPKCIEELWKAWGRWGQRHLGWYYLGVQYSNGFSQNTPCLAAMVHKDMWIASGGLRPCDDCLHSTEIEFISRMIQANGTLGATYRVSDEVLYWFRAR